MKQVTCSNCGIKLSENHSGPCTSCGETGLNVHIVVSDNSTATDSVGGEKRSEYYQKNKKTFTVVIAITVISPFLGLFILGPFGVIVGLALGGLSYYLGLLAITKVIEKEKF
jgi:hypothetical protein